MVVRQFFHKVALVVLIGLLSIREWLAKLLRQDNTESPTTTFEATEPDTLTFEWVDAESPTSEPTDSDLLTVTELADDPFADVESPPNVSRPLPSIEIHRPTADRGAVDGREHLDGKRCIFCDVPVGDDEVFVEVNKFGTLVTRPICKGHSEHPASWLRARRHDPEAMGYCPSCSDVTRQDAYFKQCATCDPVDIKTPTERRL